MLDRAPLLLLLASTLAAVAPAQQELYVHGGDGVLYRIDDYATNPTAVMVGTAGLNGSDLPVDLAIDPATGDFFVVAYPSFGISLWRVDPVTFASTQIFSGFSFFLENSLEFDAGGRLLACGGQIAELSAFDPTNGDAFPLVTGFQFPTAGDIATDIDGTLLLTIQTGLLFRYDPISGETTNLGPHGVTDAFGIEVDTDGTVYLVSGSGDIFTYDVANSTASLVGSTGVQVYGAAFKLPAGPSLGDVFGYCVPVQTPNSSGQVGRIAVSGSTVAADNDLTLHASSLPPSTFGIFMTAQNPWVKGYFPTNTTDGSLCLVNPVRLFNQAGLIRNTGAAGAFSIDVDLTNLPGSPQLGPVVTGDRLSFQAWHRDSIGTGTNYTDAKQVFFR